MIFNSARLEKEFLREGFLVLPLLSEQEVQSLQAYFKSQYKVDFSGFHSTHFIKDRQLKDEVHQKIVSIFEPRLKKYISDYKAVFGNFMVKAVGENSRMPLHADWTYVDEELHTSLGVWCPLVDTNTLNGKLGVIPKSHQFKRNYRGPQIPTPFHTHNEYIIENYGQLLPMKAGECVIYDHRLLHYSPANTSGELRPAINLVMAPKAADLVHYTNRGGYPNLEKYQASDSSFYINYEHFETPEPKAFLKNVRANGEDYTQEYVDKILRINVLEKVKAWLLA